MVREVDTARQPQSCPACVAQLQLCVRMHVLLDPGPGPVHACGRLLGAIDQCAGHTPLVPSRPPARRGPLPPSSTPVSRSMERAPVCGLAPYEQGLRVQMTPRGCLLAALVAGGR